jgi:IrrE N-terminal-like domain
MHAQRRLLEAWPRIALSRVPAQRDAARIASAVRAAVLATGDETNPLPSFRRISRAGGFEISQTTLSAASGQQEALLIPMDGNRFGICVDPTPPGGWSRIRPAIRSELRTNRHRFRVAHEIAHTFFYDRTVARPRRLLAGSPEEELFCDEFARALLLPLEAVRARPLSPASVFSLHRDYAVSVEVAARALAGAHRGTRAALWYEHPRDGWLLQWSNTTPTVASRMRRYATVDAHRGQALAVRKARCA